MPLPPEGYGGLDMLAQGLLAYCAELEEYRVICQRHAQTAVVRTKGGTIRVCRRLIHREDDTAQIPLRIMRLPGWRRTPYWASEKQKWLHLRQRVACETTGHPELRRIILRGVGWHGRPMLLHGCVQEAKRLIRLDVLLPPLPGDLPELPLRAVALALRCHEYLCPDADDAFSPPPEPPRHAMTVREYLERNTPQNLWASQCFSLTSVEH